MRTLHTFSFSSLDIRDKMCLDNANKVTKQSYLDLQSIMGYIGNKEAWIELSSYLIDGLSNQVRQFLCKGFVSGSPPQAFSWSVID